MPSRIVIIFAHWLSKKSFNFLANCFIFSSFRYYTYDWLQTVSTLLIWLRQDKLLLLARMQSGCQVTKFYTAFYDCGFINYNHRDTITIFCKNFKVAPNVNLCKFKGSHCCNVI